MAEEIEAETCSGFKRRSPDSSLTEAPLPILDESNPNTPAPDLLQCPNSASLADCENGLSKKVKFSSHGAVVETCKNSHDLAEEEQCSITLDRIEISASGSSTECSLMVDAIDEKALVDTDSVCLRISSNSTECSLMVDTIDEKALVDTDSITCGTTVIEHHFDCTAEDVMGKQEVILGPPNVLNQNTHGNKEKRPRRRGKNAKKLNENVATTRFAVDDGCEEKREKPGKTYSREELQSLRFVNTGAQRNKWVAVYCGLAPHVAIEYDALNNSDDQKKISFDFDPRKQFGKKKSIRDVGEHCSQGTSDEIGNTTSSTPGNRLSADDNYDISAEEFSEEADSDDDYSSIQRPAFSVTGEPNFESGPPQDGWEYLRRVRWEAAHIPKVKVAKIERSKLKKEQSVYMPKIPDIPKCPDHLLPLKEWEDGFLADFAELRKAISRLDDSASVISGECYSALPESILVEKFDNLSAADGAEANECHDCSMIDTDTSVGLGDTSPKSFTNGGSSSDSPTLSAILGMDSVARLSMLKKRIKSADSTSSLSKNDCSWLFALCAAIDTPLDADTCASLRCLLRKTATLRAEKSDLDDEVIMLNILATITGKYFGQSEL